MTFSLTETKRKAHAFNYNSRAGEQDFSVKYPEETDVLLANFVLKSNKVWPYGLKPYLGLGIGAAEIDIAGATSIQVNPAEVGINHYNTKRPQALIR